MISSGSPSTLSEGGCDTIFFIKSLNHEIDVLMKFESLNSKGLLQSHVHDLLSNPYFDY